MGNSNLHLHVSTGSGNVNNIPQTHSTKMTTANHKTHGAPNVDAAADESVAAALKDIKMAIQATRVLQHQGTRIPHPGVSPTSTMTMDINRTNNPGIGSVIMNGSTVATSKVPVIGEGSNIIPHTENVSSVSQQNNVDPQIASNLTGSEQTSVDPWVPRNNVAPSNLHALPSLVTNKDAQAAGATHGAIAATSHNKSIQSNIATVAPPGNVNISQSAQILASQAILQKEASSLPMQSRLSTSNGTVLSSGVALQQPANTPSVKEPVNSNNVLIAENMTAEKGAGRRNRIHSQDINIEEDDDIDEDDEEDEEEEEGELEDEESESEVGEERVPTPKNIKDAADDDLDTDQETDRLLGQQYNDDNGYYDSKVG